MLPCLLATTPLLCLPRKTLSSSGLGEIEVRALPRGFVGYSGRGRWLFRPASGTIRNGQTGPIIGTQYLKGTGCHESTSD